MTPRDLEAAIDRELRRLPPPTAPSTLLPRVMAAARAVAPRPWYQRAWISWPIGWQLASAFLLFGLVASGMHAWPGVETAIARAATPFTGSAARRAASVSHDAGPVVALARVLWTAIVQRLVVYAFLFITVMGAACAAGAAALSRVALGGATQS